MSSCCLPRSMPVRLRMDGLLDTAENGSYATSPAGTRAIKTKHDRLVAPGGRPPPTIGCQASARSGPLERGPGAQSNQSYPNEPPAQHPRHAWLLGTAPAAAARQTALTPWHPGPHPGWAWPPRPAWDGMACARIPPCPACFLKSCPIGIRWPSAAAGYVQVLAAIPMSPIPDPLYGTFHRWGR